MIGTAAAPDAGFVIERAILGHAPNPIDQTCAECACLADLCTPAAPEHVLPLEGYAMSANSLRRENGFSLIDVMAAVLVVGVVSAIALPVTGSSLAAHRFRADGQALSNLVFNAMKYGVRNAPIHISLNGTSKDELVLGVQNSGKPIPPDLMARLFDPLVRQGGEDAGADSQVAGANLGLGLYVVREIAKAHGGTVEVTSDESATRFELRLPRVSMRSGSLVR